MSAPVRTDCPERLDPAASLVKTLSSGHGHGPLYLYAYECGTAWALWCVGCGTPLLTITGMSQMPCEYILEHGHVAKCPGPCDPLVEGAS